MVFVVHHNMSSHVIGKALLNVKTQFLCHAHVQVRMRDVVIVPHVWEHYDNITHQTFEATRAAALDPAMTHLLKVPTATCCIFVPGQVSNLHMLCWSCSTLSMCCPSDPSIRPCWSAALTRSKSLAVVPVHMTIVQHRWTTTAMFGSRC
jgi:hypothetical protein